jgi:hypothetical protein
VKKEKKDILKHILMVMMLVLSFASANADEVTYKYQGLLIQKANTMTSEETRNEDSAWNNAKLIAQKYVDISNLEKPTTLVVKDQLYLDYSRKLKGIYDPELNIAIATDYNILVHEYLHAIFYLTGNYKLASDESFIRGLYQF